MTLEEITNEYKAMNGAEAQVYSTYGAPLNRVVFQTYLPGGGKEVSDAALHAATNGLSNEDRDTLITDLNTAVAGVVNYSIGGSGWPCR